MAPLVLTGMQCGLLSLLALIVPMLLSACPIGPWAIDSTCNEGHAGNGQEGHGGLVPVCGALAVRANGQCLERGGCTFSACSSWLPLKFGEYL